MKGEKEILKSLNDHQRQAVINFQGPSLIIAGAGSGKTRVLTHRIAYMMQQGVHPARIMALTFTNKAADEMKERIAHMVSYKQARQLWMGTFHSIFRRILKEEAYKLNFDPNFTIYDTDDSKSLLKNVIKELNLDTEKYKVNDILSRISKAKNNLITYNAYKNNKELLEADVQRKNELIWKIYEQYQLRLKTANAMDFDDLLLNTNILFRDFKDILAKYQDLFDYILVDEYQDTNYAQYLIIKKISEKKQNLCVVGDDSQSIYSFRGARIENILNFKNDYPTYKLFKLEQNYRSTQTIVNAANSLIEHNQERIPKVIYSENEKGEKIELLKGLTESEEAFIVAKIAQELKNKEHIPYNEMAVLYRINAQSRVLEDSFRRLNIPYKIYGSLSFYQRKEIKDVIAYIRLVVNNKDDEALLRIINIPARGIGPTTLEKIQDIALQHQTSIWEIITNENILNQLLKNAFVNKVQHFTNLIQELSNSINLLSALEFIEFLVKKSGIIEELTKENTQEALSRKENIQELVNSIKDYEDAMLEELGIKPNIIDFLEHVSLLSTVDEQNDKNKNAEKVTLMTAHAAKGLEFQVVFIVGAEKSLFPLEFHSKTENNFEEERRLFYVALTRAKEKAYISFAEQRNVWGKSQATTPSPFISEIDSQYLKIPYNFEANKFESNYSQRTYISHQNIKSTISVPSFEKKLVSLNKIQNQNSTKTSSNLFKDIVEGVYVHHERFGKGKVIKVEGNDTNTKALVDFEMSGQKQLLLKYAKLTVL
ncbi:MAG TPA: UvrD-helicase domain-containing protein [Bacteroidales bacterium]|nr:UvrD-helicase domain-containing protein [Bacteroidales bacterium]